jgi:excisionase family DNA binding protein
VFHFRTYAPPAPFGSTARPEGDTPSGLRYRLMLPARSAPLGVVAVLWWHRTERRLLVWAQYSTAQGATVADQCVGTTSSKMPQMAHDAALQQLKQALQAHQRSLEELEKALMEFEAILPNDAEAQKRLGSPELQLLSIAEVCRTLGMGKSWTYRRLKSGEIPSVKLGRTIKVKREDLEAYLEKHRYRPTDAQ